MIQGDDAATASADKSGASAVTNGSNGGPPASKAGDGAAAVAQRQSPEELQAQVAALRTNIQAVLAEKKDGAAPDSWWKRNASAPSLNPQKPPTVSRILRGHFGKVYALSWAGNSEQLVSASQDGKLICWSAASTNKIQAIPLRSSWVMCAAYEKESDEMVACGGLDNMCSVYKLGSEGGLSVTRAHRELTGHEGYLSSCAFNGPNQVLTSSGDGTCQQWDIETAASIAKFTAHTADVMDLATSPNNPNLFASGSVDSMALIHDTRAGKCVLSFAGHESDINSVSFFPDGQAIGTGSDDATSRLFDMRACRELASYEDQSIVCGVTSVDFSKSGRLLFAGFDDFTTMAFDVTRKDRPLMLKLHENRVSCLEVNREGSALATGSWDSLLKISA